MFLSFFDQFKQAKNVAVISHARPDADAIGCTIALGSLIRNIPGDRKVTLLNEDGCPSRYHSLLNGFTFVKPADVRREDFDLVISVDCATRKGMGPVACTWPIDINFDHHESNERYAEYNKIQSRFLSNAEHLFQIFYYDFQNQGTLYFSVFTKEISDALYLGMVGDTGNFRYFGVTYETFFAAHHLIKWGANPVAISAIESKLPVNVLRESVHFMDRVEWSENDRLAFCEIGLHDYQRLNRLNIDSLLLKKQLLEQMMSSETTKIACLMTRISSDLIVGSLRAVTPIDVNEFAKTNFGGGGHQLAAGLSIPNPTEFYAQEIKHKLSQLL